MTRFTLLLTDEKHHRLIENEDRECTLKRIRGLRLKLLERSLTSRSARD